MSFILEMDKVQDFLSFRHCTSKVFQDDGIGKIGFAGYLLGLFGGLHLGFIILSYYIVNLNLSVDTTDYFSILLQWSVYFFLLCSFHFIEFFVTAYYQENNLSYESYVINHSSAYTIAAVTSWIEYWMEIYFFGKTWKLNSFTYCFGLFLLLFGQIVRTLSMSTCGENFAHQIAHSRPKDHQLITHGIYSIFRHPSYFGWFYWSVGTQIFLCNPICIVAYTWASWNFFKTRIPYEERLLIQFYGQKYIQYMKNTVIGIPLIYGLNSSYHNDALNIYKNNNK